MLLHKKSRALFEETLLGGYYLLEGINLKGSFRLSTDFLKDFIHVYDLENLKEVPKADMVGWRRMLIYYIGKDREIQRNRAKAINEARKQKQKELGGEPMKDITIEGSVIKDLDVNYKVIEYTYSSIFKNNLGISELSREIAKLFEGEHGRITRFGHIINNPRQPLYFNFEDGVQIRILIDRDSIEEKKVEASNQPKKAPEVKKDKVDKAAKKVNPKATKDVDSVGVDYISQKTGLPASKIRAKLRKIMEKPDGGWNFTKERAEELIKKIS